MTYTQGRVDSMKYMHVLSKLCICCKLCELICSEVHFGAFNPRRSRIKVIFDLWEGEKDVKICRQCKDPQCVIACPTRALEVDGERLAVKLEAERCTGCGDCVSSCPYDALRLDPLERTPLVCDVCGTCVKVCPTKAIWILTK